MLQGQIIFKQLQEMRQQQQLQESGDVRQLNYINHLSLLNKQSSGGLDPPLINGMPVHDASKKVMVGNMHLTQHGASPGIQGFPNGMVFSQAQSQAMSIGMLSQQPDVSLYGTPVASSGCYVNQYSHLQGVSNDSANMLSRGNNNQMEIVIPIMQPSTVSNSFLTEQFNASVDKVSILDGTLVPKNLFQEKNLFGQVPLPASNDGVLPLNFQQVHLFQKNALMKESGMGQEQTCWPVITPAKTPKPGSSQGTASLDPLEEKILFNTDDSSWESVLGGHGNIVTSGFEGTREHVEFMGTFSSTQSGSWSALMQSAVAEASRSDTGQQEEWSGLTFQNPELSADNQPPSYIGNGKQQNTRVDNNLQSVFSPTSKPEILYPNSNTNYNFPGFQQSSYQVAKQRDRMQSDSSHESVQHSPNTSAKWFGCNSQLKQPVKGCQLVQTASPVQGDWHDQQFECSENDRRQSSISAHTYGSESCNNLVGQGLRENVWQNRSRPQPLIGGSQNPSYQATHSSGNQGQAYPGQLNFIGNDSDIGNSGKVHMPGIQRNLSALKEIPPRKNVDSIAALFDTPADFCGQSIISHTSENTLDLFKQDTSLEHRSGIYSGSRDSVPLSQVSQISGDLPHYNISSASRGASLRLGPPSQQMPKSYSSLNSPIQVSSSAAFTSDPLYMGNHPQNQLMHVTPVASQSVHAALPGISSRYRASIATPQDASNLFQTSIHNQEFPTLDTIAATLPSLVSHVPKQIGLSVRPSIMSPNVPNQQQVMQSEAPMVSLNARPSRDSTNRNVEMPIGTPNEQDKQNALEIGSNLKEINAHRGTAQAGLINSFQEFVPASPNRLVHGQESFTKYLSEVNATNSGSSMIIAPHQAFYRSQQTDNDTPNMSERDFEAFGHSLRPSHSLQQDFSLLHQVRYLKNLEAGHSNKVPLKFNEVDSGLVFQYLNGNARQPLLYGQKLGVRNLAQCEPNTRSQLNSFSSGENKPLSCSSEVVGDQPNRDSARASIQDTRGIVMFGPTDTDNHFKQPPQINVQMVPSWFKSYGNLKNGQMIPMHDVESAKDAGKQFSIGKSFENFQLISSIGEANYTNASQKSSLLPTSATNEVASLSPPSMLPSDDAGQDLAVLRPKKRKVAAFDLLPWHKEVTQGSLQLQQICRVAESEWASASNRLSEKVEEEDEINEDVLPIFRAKKRLILTTQLMQQVLRPAPTVLFSVDAFSSGESITYSMCRLALGDACSLTCDSHMPLLTTDMSSTKQRHSDTIREQDFSKTVENFIDRAKRLQSNFLRLDKTASIVDIRVESQELEKFSVINRFAKFHSRGNIVPAETSSASVASPAVLKSFSQRYVVAHPMPKMVPDGTSCLSL